MLSAFEVGVGLTAVGLAGLDAVATVALYRHGLPRMALALRRLAWRVRDWLPDGEGAAAVAKMVARHKVWTLHHANRSRAPEPLHYFRQPIIRNPANAIWPIRGV